MRKDGGRRTLRFPQPSVTIMVNKPIFCQLLNHSDLFIDRRGVLGFDLLQVGRERLRSRRREDETGQASFRDIFKDPGG
jgi:hypothetical protein